MRLLSIISFLTLLPLYSISASWCSPGSTPEPLVSQVHAVTEFEWKSPQKFVFCENHADLFFASRSFSRGEILYVAIRSKSLSVENFRWEFSGLQGKFFGNSQQAEIYTVLSPRLRSGYYFFHVVHDGCRHDFRIPVQEAAVEYPAPLSNSEATPTPVEWESYKLLLTDEKSTARAMYRDRFFIDSNLYLPLPAFKVTSDFYIKRQGSFLPIHQGIDLKADFGDHIRAMATGSVVYSLLSIVDGNSIIINHGAGITTGYMHMSRVVVRKGQFVKAGELIGYAGSTGNATGPHLHLYMLVDGQYADPLSLLSLPSIMGFREPGILYAVPQVEEQK